MRFKFTEQQDALRREVKDFLEKEWDEEAQLRAEEAGELASGHSPTLHQKVASKGLVALNWPTEYGGRGWTPIEMAIFAEELGYHKVLDGVYRNTMIIGNSICHFGTDEQKKKYLPDIAAGKTLFSIGYTEPNAGSDLASLETRAAEDGDEYVINGVKVFNTGGHIASYCWLATRTDPDAPKHRGISVFIVDLKSPGITIRPLHNVADGHGQNELVFQDVRVPKENMVGEKNRGWYLMAKALDIERIRTSPSGRHQRVLEMLIEYCKETKRNGIPLIKDPLVRQQIVQLYTEAKAARLISYKVIYQQSKGEIPDVPASMAKLSGSELSQKIAHLGMQLLGPRSIIHGSSKWSAMNGELEHMVRETITYTISAGASEIQRMVIAGRGLGLPRG
ncbi:MAG: acyl-CoA dehydrogenase family protein [Chloroflexi bacterium]|nr:acyl-CoA dehydrogenase family protein [Chloroflexota bacterium]